MNDAPAWMTGPIGVDELYGPDAPPGASGPWPLRHAFRDIESRVANRLEGFRGIERCSGRARRGMVLDLLGRLSLAARQVLTDPTGGEAPVTRSFDDSSEWGWDAVTAEFRSLLPLMEQIEARWEAATREFLRRLDADSELLGAKLRLTGFRRIGNLHGGGRAVTRLQVESEDAAAGWIYKPRSLAGEVLWYRCVEQLEELAEVDGAPVPVPRMVERRVDGEPYGWMEALPPRPSPESVGESELERRGKLRWLDGVLDARELGVEYLLDPDVPEPDPLGAGGAVERGYRSWAELDGGHDAVALAIEEAQDSLPRRVAVRSTEAYTELRAWSAGPELLRRPPRDRRAALDERLASGAGEVPETTRRAESEALARFDIPAFSRGPDGDLRESGQDGEPEQPT